MNFWLFSIPCTLALPTLSLITPLSPPGYRFLLHHSHFENQSGEGSIIILRKLIPGFSFSASDVGGGRAVKIILEGLRDAQGCLARRQQAITGTNEWGHHDR